MKIGIDISQVVYEGTGVGRYTRGLIEAILTYDTKNQWVFLFSALRGKIDNTLLEKIKSSKHRLIRLPFSPPMLSFMWNTLHVIPVEIFTGPLDLFISSDWTQPPTRCKKATIIHDLAYLRYPETIHPSILETQKKRMKWVMKEIDYVIATSIATKSDIISLLNISRSKITSLYSGVTMQLPAEETVRTVREKFNLQGPFVLTVGKVEPRKNSARLIEGFTQTKKDDWDLVIVGPQGWDYVSKETKKTNIKFTGYISDDELSALYHLCQFFVYPSLWEGFGYPVIEAMLHKKAVAASNNSSLKELVEGHGVLFDPLSTFDIAASLTTLMDDITIRQSNEQKGYEYAKQFTWKKYYEGLMKIFI